MAQAQYKACPRCGTPHYLQSPACSCGHQFRTQFTQPQNLNQTQAIPGYTPPQPNFQAPHQFQGIPQPMILPAVKDFEWYMKTFWLWLGVVTIIPAAINNVIYSKDINLALVFFGIASACMVGLSRMYQRVNFQGLAISFGVAFIIGTGCLLAINDTTEKRNKEQQRLENLYNPTFDRSFYNR